LEDSLKILNEKIIEELPKNIVKKFEEIEKNLDEQENIINFFKISC